MLANIRGLFSSSYSEGMDPSVKRQCDEILSFRRDHDGRLPCRGKHSSVEEWRLGNLRTKLQIRCARALSAKPSHRKLNTDEIAYFKGAVSEPPIAAVRSCPQSRGHDVPPTTSDLEIDAVSSNAGVSPPSIDQEIVKPSAWTIPIPAGSFNAQCHNVRSGSVEPPATTEGRSSSSMSPHPSIGGMSVTNNEVATASSKQDHTHDVAPPIASEASKKRSEPSATGMPLPTSRQNPKMPRTSTHAGASSSAYLSPAEPVDTNVWPGRAMRMQKAEGVTDDNAM